MSNSPASFDLADAADLMTHIGLVNAADPYVTDKGGIVILCGPFPLDKARKIAEFYRRARHLLPACLEEIARLRAELECEPK